MDTTVTRRDATQAPLWAAIALMLAGWAPRTAGATAGPLDIEVFTHTAVPTDGSPPWCGVCAVRFGADGSWCVEAVARDAGLGVPARAGRDGDGARAFFDALVRFAGDWRSAVNARAAD